MAKIDNPGNTAQVEVEPGLLALRAVILARGYGYSASQITGTMAAALAANSSIFSMRLDSGASGGHAKAYVERIRLKFTTLVAFTTPVTAGRRLELYRGSGITPSGGTAGVVMPKKGATDTSEISIANGGDIRIATTGALTMTGGAFEAGPIRGMSLGHVGAAGGFYDCLWEFHATENQPIQLDAGQVLAVRTPVAFDAGGTWQLQVDVDWHEATEATYAG